MSAERTCRDCGRKGTRGFWHSTDPPLGGWYCNAAAACAKRMTDRQRAEFWTRNEPVEKVAR